MKRVMLLMAVLLFAQVGYCADWVFYGSYTEPDKPVFSHAAGAGVGVQQKVFENLYLCPSLGLSEGDYETNRVNTKKRGVWSETTGKILDVTLGLSALYKYPLGPGNLLAEAGGSYHVISSDLYQTDNRWKRSSVHQRDVGGAWTCEASVGYELPIHKLASVYTSIGYQRQLSSAVVTSNKEFNGAFAKAGLILKLP